ncbi:hypothetical protein [Rhodovulum adriaticum]|uniref:Lipoprotein n=1 Tax=Rhodovulum adriaticum TaxID=35804 RepID=A0A4R2NL20_RHOAD|nr:hypothetical protein [Rhodovulum adriaticum]MBK1635457.1 hypothetical protein [Rhodovulum adriaticum]TCP22028.1 hypothetical protein EV656_10874 [Rhodovulum adriaticum]
MRRFLIALALPLILAACTAEPVWAPDEAVARAVYRSPEPPSITLFTMVNNRSNAGAHSALMVNASQRVIFDPAGSWWHRTAPERNDVHYGITPLMLDFFIDYHARETYHVVMQTVEVSPETAERALRLIEQNGAVPKAMCGQSISSVLRQVPGFESIPRSFGPKVIMRGFGQIPGVKTRKIYDDDPDDHKTMLGQDTLPAPRLEAQPATAG